MRKLNSNPQGHDLQLAIDGGTPAVTSAAPVWPIADRALRDGMAQAFANHTWGTYHGPWLDALAERLSETFGCAHVHGCSSGTVAVELALRGCGVKPGDDVILAGYDFAGNFRAIETIGAMPVLVDVIADGWVIDPNTVAEACSTKTSAIVVSHLHGQLADIAAIRDVLPDSSIRIVEDACQTPGSFYDGQPVGSFGDVSTLSFGGSKLLSAGRGGAVLTNDATIAQRIKIANERGNEACPLSQLQAIVLGPQLDSLTQMNETRNSNAAYLCAQVRAQAKPLVTLQAMSQVLAKKPLIPAFFKLPFLLNSTHSNWDRTAWLAAAQAEGVPIDAGFRGFLKRPDRRCRKSGSLTHSKIAAEQTMLLHHPILQCDAETMDQLAVGLKKIDAAASATKNTFQPPKQG